MYRRKAFIAFICYSVVAMTDAFDYAMTETYKNLALKSIALQEKSMTKRQLWIAIAGGPGSGKSTLANAVSEHVNKITTFDFSVVIPMDGFHYSRQQLKDIESSGTATFEALLARRGSPWTFDAKGLVDALKMAKEAGEASLPVYSRKLSDPVANGVSIRKVNRIVFVEGNYLLNFDDPEWEPLRSIFDEKWFINCDPWKQRERLIRRHLETWTEEKTRMWGAGEEGAARKADANDVLNADFVNLFSRKYADFIIESV